jgi:23S rRNA (adenine2503-C2)-methyltransferase
MAKLDLKNLSLKELEEFLAGRKYPAYHASQIFSWVYQKGAPDFTSMSNLPLDLRNLLADNFHIGGLRLVKKEISADGTGKFLFALEDGNAIESAVIPTPKRKTACLSSQAGCNFKCGFCASGLKGKERDLATAEIVGQLMMLNGVIAPERVSHVVLMGTGEPLDNYENVMKAIRLINSPLALGIAARRITVSTCGIIPGIERLAGEKLQVELSVSLHAADNATRNKLMPVNKKYPLEKLIAACRQYAKTTKRQVTFEYILIKEMNCDLKSAANLAQLLKGWDCKINLIPYNPIKEFDFEPPAKLETLFFRDRLTKSGVRATIRMPRGKDIHAACGQLRYYTD